MSLKSVSRCLNLFGVLGLGLSLYAYYVELNMEEDDAYQPMCNINDYMRCTKAFGSKYGKGFGIFPEGSLFHIPNSLYGIGFYITFLTIAHFFDDIASSKLLLFLSFLSNCSSVYFASILIFILRDICVVCVSLYCVNLALIILTYRRYKMLIGKNKME